MEELKEAFGIVLMTNRENQTGGEENEKMEEILRITKAQLEKLPVGEKPPQLARKKKMFRCVISYFEMKRAVRRNGHILTKRGIKASSNTLKHTVSLQNETLLLYRVVFTTT